MKEYSYTSTHPLGHTGPVTVFLYLYLYVYLVIVEHIKLIVVPCVWVLG
jgi:hypothetical protein